MKRMSRLFNRSSDDVGWISTTDMFVVACCFMLFLAVSFRRRAGEAEGKLTLVTEQLETNRAMLSPDILQPIDTVNEEKDQLLAKLNDARKQLIAAANQHLQEKEVLLNEKLTLSEKLANVQSALDMSKAAINQLQVDIETADQESNRIREQAISQLRSFNNKLVGLGGKLENVVLMVDVSKSMQSGKGQNGVVLNNWVPIVEVIERWINGLNVTSAALIVFGDRAELKVGMQKLDQGGRERILEVIQQIDPDADGTNFLAAFEEAYRIPNVDTIIVFSDGLPSVDVNGDRIFVDEKKIGESDSAYASRFYKETTENVNRVLAVHRRISEMAKQHPSVSVNAIGLGAGVYNEKTGNLLNDLALNNGGVFLALPSRIVEDAPFGTGNE
jgi:hypothetical protein